MNSIDIDTRNLEGGTAQLAAVAVGIVAHLFVFRIGEWDLTTTTLVVSFFGLQLISAAALSHFVSDHVSLHDSLVIVSRLAFLALGGLFSSMIVYRAFFHRLSKFPGPFWARISNLYITFLSAKKMHLYAEVQELHKQYGDIVRLGKHPAREFLLEFRRILSNSLRPFRIIHQQQTRCRRDPRGSNTLHQRAMVQHSPPHGFVAIDSQQTRAC